MEIIMLSNDVDNRKQAAAIGIKAMSVHVPPPPPPPQYVHLREVELAHQARSACKFAPLAMPACSVVVSSPWAGGGGAEPRRWGGGVESHDHERRQGRRSLDAAGVVGSQAYVKSRADGGELAEVVAHSEAAEDAAGGGDDGSRRPGKRARIYPDHRTASDISAGMKSGKLHQVRWPAQAGGVLGMASADGAAAGQKEAAGRDRACADWWLGRLQRPARLALEASEGRAGAGHAAGEPVQHQRGVGVLRLRGCRHPDIRAGGHEPRLRRRHRGGGGGRPGRVAHPRRCRPPSACLAAVDHPRPDPTATTCEEDNRVCLGV